MTITLDTSYPHSGYQSPITPGNFSTGICPIVTSGALVIFLIYVDSPSGTFSAVSDSNGTVGTLTQQGTYVDSTNAQEYEIWTGIAASSSYPNISFTLNTAGTFFSWVVLSLDFSGTQNWRLVGSTAGIVNASNSIVQYPTITSDGSADQAYVAFNATAATPNSGSASTGFTEFVTSSSAASVYDLALSSNTLYDPTITMSGFAWSSGIAAIFSADVAPTVVHYLPSSRPSFVPQMRASTW